MINYFKNTSTNFSKNKDNKYFKNSEELLNDEENSINEEDFKYLIKEEIFMFMGHFDNIILLAGAGASVVGDKDPNFGHTVEMLGEEVKKQLQPPKYYTIEEICSMCNYNTSSDNNIFNLEDLLSRMQSYLQFVPDKEKYKFNKSYKKIIEVIKDKTSYSYDKNSFKHGKLIKQLTELHVTPNRLSVVTTNYDTVIEESAYNLNFTVFDGFTFSHQPIFDIDMFDWNLSKPISVVKSQKEAYKKSVINLLKIHGSLTWKRDGNNIVRSNKKEIEEPIMIFPSSNKYMQSYEKPYFELFSKFQELLRRPNTILITSGFSFADNHISQMIIQAIKAIPSLSLLITDFNIDTKEPNKNWKNLLDLMNDDYNIAFLKATMNMDLTDYFTRGENDD
ncbi:MULTISPECIES: SIR2 family protein [Staphylococcus]|nr:MULTISPECIES: SIR2 family protein [Staphylococcus]QQT20340.1 SIR2 family protein [Staphylococcus pasteuri]VXC81342.1 conserved hypothetical protein [Staphylococcus sp. 8AQ]